VCVLRVSQSRPGDRLPVVHCRMVITGRFSMRQEAKIEETREETRKRPEVRAAAFLVGAPASKNWSPFENPPAACGRWLPRRRRQRVRVD